MYSNTANFGKICVLCIQKAPQSAVGEYTARTSCRQGALSPSEALRSCTAHESGGPAPAQGLLPEQLHHEIVFQPPGPCAGTTSHTGRGSRTLLNAWPMCKDDPSASPTPATCRYPPPANARRLPCPLQSETSRRWASLATIRLMACSSAKPRGTADYIISGPGRQRDAAQSWA